MKKQIKKTEETNLVKQEKEILIKIEEKIKKTKEDLKKMMMTGINDYT